MPATIITDVLKILLIAVLSDRKILIIPEFFFIYSSSSHNCDFV